MKQQVESQFVTGNAIDEGQSDAQLPRFVAVDPNFGHGGFFSTGDLGSDLRIR